MFDAVSPGALPRSAVLVAGYDDGLYDNVAAIHARFPGALLVDITVSARHDWGQVLDVETGDATPDEAPGWVVRRRAAGADPSVYCNTSTWPDVRAAFRSAAVLEPHYWIAQYDGDPTIPTGAVAKQYLSTAGWDESSVADYWPGVDPAPVSPPTTPPEDIVTPQDIDTIAAAVWEYGLPHLHDDWTPDGRTVPAHWFVAGADIRQDGAVAWRKTVDARMAQLQQTVTAQGAAVTALVAQLGVQHPGVDTAAVVSAVQAAIAAAVVHVDVAVTQPPAAPVPTVPPAAAK
jgi:hypothetical protein